MSLPLPNGSSLEVSKVYIDGIFDVDPISVVVRSGKTQIVETGPARDAILSCASDAPCLVYNYHSPFALLPTRTEMLDEHRRGTTNEPTASLVGAALSLIEHWAGYSFAAGIAFALASLARSAWRRLRTHSVLAAVSGAGVIVGVTCWLYIVIRLSRLSLPLIGVVCALILAGLHRYGAVRSSRTRGQRSIAD